MRLALLVPLFACLLLFGCFGQEPVKPVENNTVPPAVPLIIIPPNTTQNTTVPVLEGCAGKQSAEERDACYSLEGGKGSVEDCEKVENVVTRNSCFYSAARSLNFSGVCESIRNYAERTACIEEINPPCSLAENESKALCLAKFYNNAEKCGDYGDSCIYDYASSTLNLSACSLISSTLKKHACQAFVSNDLSFCQNLPATDNTTRDACYTNVAKLKNDSSLCYYAVTRTYVNLCYEHFALANNDASACSKKYDEFDRDDCYSVLASRTRNASVCGLIVSGFMNKTLADVCRNNVAKDTGKPETCSGIIVNYHRYNCYAYIVESPDADYGKESCDAIPAKDTSWKDACYSRLSKKTGDKTLCEQITDSALKETCNPANLLE
ncbi:hypothetical protein HY992_05090 [Candidatus Micrarchaeota archaeon]|nr:hypothetical protein [Candidatus Micrarchaeota archaeon]